MIYDNRYHSGFDVCVDNADDDNDDEGDYYNDDDDGCVFLRT